uniref:Uncharacterized protein n=1 Tax=Anguilla anguilla TaxID=7936 RepID=A0A0E9V2F8_ANGAN
MLTRSFATLTVLTTSLNKVFCKCNDPGAFSQSVRIIVNGKLLKNR